MLIKFTNDSKLVRGRSCKDRNKTKPHKNMEMCAKSNKIDLGDCKPLCLEKNNKMYTYSKSVGMWKATMLREIRLIVENKYT